MPKISIAQAEVAWLMLKYGWHPDQPRVPAGNGRESGRWGDGGGIVVAQGRSGRGRGASLLEGTPAQQARLVLSSAQREAALARVRETLPNWRPHASLSASTIEGEIARNEAETRQANDALFGFRRDALAERSLRECFAPGGEPLGYRAPGATSNIRTVPQAEFDSLLDQVTRGAVPISTPSGVPGQWYERPDGNRIGLRFSQDYGWTVDVVRSNDPAFPSSYKVHQK